MSNRMGVLLVFEKSNRIERQISNIREKRWLSRHQSHRQQRRRSLMPIWRSSIQLFAKRPWKASIHILPVALLQWGVHTPWQYSDWRRSWGWSRQDVFVPAISIMSSHWNPTDCMAIMDRGMSLYSHALTNDNILHERELHHEVTQTVITLTTSVVDHAMEQRYMSAQKLQDLLLPLQVNEQAHFGQFFFWLASAQFSWHDHDSHFGIACHSIGVCRASNKTSIGCPRDQLEWRILRPM